MPPVTLQCFSKLYVAVKERGRPTLLTAIAGVLGIVALVVAGQHAWAAAVHVTSIDLLAVLIIAFINYWLVKGVKHTARMTAVFVVIKLAVAAVIRAAAVAAANYVPPQSLRPTRRFVRSRSRRSETAARGGRRPTPALTPHPASG